MQQKHPLPSSSAALMLRKFGQDQVHPKKIRAICHLTAYKSTTPKCFFCFQNVVGATSGCQNLAEKYVYFIFRHVSFTSPKFQVLVPKSPKMECLIVHPLEPPSGFFSPLIPWLTQHEATKLQGLDLSPVQHVLVLPGIHHRASENPRRDRVTKWMSWQLRKLRLIQIKHH